MAWVPNHDMMLLPPLTVASLILSGLINIAFQAEHLARAASTAEPTLSTLVSGSCIVSTTITIITITIITTEQVGLRPVIPRSTTHTQKPHVRNAHCTPINAPVKTLWIPSEYLLMIWQRPCWYDSDWLNTNWRCKYGNKRDPRDICGILKCKFG